MHRGCTLSSFPGASALPLANSFVHLGFFFFFLIKSNTFNHLSISCQLAVCQSRAARSALAPSKANMPGEILVLGMCTQGIRSCELYSGFAVRSKISF